MKTIKNQKRNNLLISLLIIILGSPSCIQQDTFLEYRTIPTSGWHQDSIYKFDFKISDTQKLYNIYINTRNTSSYQYQNLWLFLKVHEPNNTSKDTINFYLADQTGKWLGSGVGSVFEMQVLYLQNYKFKKTGNYQIEVTQGMRDIILDGVNNIGLQIQEVEK